MEVRDSTFHERGRGRTCRCRLEGRGVGVEIAMTTAGLSAVTEVRRTDERSSILNVLYEADEPLGPREIAIAINTKRNNLDQLLYKMAKAREVLKAERGRYIHPTRTDLIEVRPSAPHKNDKKIRSEDDPVGGSG